MKYFIFILIVLGAMNLFAESLTLHAATSLAEQNSPDIKRLTAAAERVSWTKNEALSGHMPHLSVGYDHYFESIYERENIVFGGAGVSFPAGYPQDSISVGVSLTLFDGLESIRKYQAAGLNTEAAQLDLSREKFKVDEMVRLSFFQALAAQKLFDVAKQNVDTLEDHLKRAKLTERTGYGTQFDVLRIEATLEEARADQEQAENNVQITRDNLNEAMGVVKAEAQVLEGELPVLTEADLPKNLSPSVKDRQDIQSQMKKEEASQAMGSAAKGFWYPQVSLFAEEQYYKFGDFDPSIVSNSSFQNAYAFGLRLKWNIFDGGYSYARSQEANQVVIEQQAETQKALLDLPREIDKWKRQFNHSVSLYRARLRALAQYQESVRLAGIGIKAGSRTHTEMLDAELDLFRARGGLVKAQAEAIEALGKLELAVGRNLWTAQAK